MATSIERTSHTHAKSGIKSVAQSINCNFHPGPSTHPPRPERLSGQDCGCPMHSADQRQGSSLPVPPAAIPTPAPAFRGSPAGHHPPHQIHTVLQPQRRASPAAVSPQRRATAALSARSPEPARAVPAGSRGRSALRTAVPSADPHHLQTLPRPSSQSLVWPPQRSYPPTAVLLPGAGSKRYKVQAIDFYPDL